MNVDDIDSILADITPSNVMSPEMLARLRKFSLLEREYIAFKTKTLVVYFDEEVSHVREAEEVAALKAMPYGYPIDKLNGLNIGSGDRTIHPALIQVDITRVSLIGLGGHCYATPSAILSSCAKLPFADNSIDFIIALHFLEHIFNPIDVLRHWHNKLKPGGGVGIILPDWRYTWDARFDEAAYGHKWNCEPDLLAKLYEDKLQDIYALEALNTYNYKISFDVVLRKGGAFKPFNIPLGEDSESGASRFRRGQFLGLLD